MGNRSSFTDSKERFDPSRNFDEWAETEGESHAWTEEGVKNTTDKAEMIGLVKVSGSLQRITPQTDQTHCLFRCVWTTVDP